MHRGSGGCAPLTEAPFHGAVGEAVRRGCTATPLRHVGAGGAGRDLPDDRVGAGAAGGLERPYRGVFVVPGGRRDYFQEVAAAVLSAGPAAAAAGETAAAVWGLTPHLARPVVIVVRHERSLRPLTGRLVRRSVTLSASDVTRVTTCR